MSTPQYFSGSGHYYQISSTPSSWASAVSSAAVLSYRGLYGYLATVTTSGENNFLLQLNSANTVQENYLWLGGSDSGTTEGTWTWRTGPEVGETFSIENSTTSTQVSYGYTNWNSDGYPNIWSGDEDYLVFYASHHSDPYGSGGKWADSQEYTNPNNSTNENGVRRFFIEYGGLSATYSVTASASSVNEGSSVTFTINTTNIEWGQTISYTLSGISQADLSSGSLTGTATVNQNVVDGRATVSVTLASDQITEGNETLTITVQGQTASTTIVDTSTTPTPTPSNPICFLKGTQVRLTSGEACVESLMLNQAVEGANEQALVKWIGRQRRTPEFAQFDDYLPVKICAGALAENAPVRDLYLSPDHAVLVDGHLIHAQALVNGRTIIKMTEWEGDIEYYHIETENHEIIFAEGVPCETFIDNVSREQFDNYAEYQALYPYTQMMRELPLPRVKFKPIPFSIVAASWCLALMNRFC